MIKKLFVDLILNSDLHLFSKVAYKIGYIDALREVANIVHNAEYPEYLEEDLYEFLKDKEISV